MKCCPLILWHSWCSTIFKVHLGIVSPDYKQRRKGAISGVRLFLPHCKLLKQGRCLCPKSTFASTTHKEISSGCKRGLAAIWPLRYVKGVSLSMSHSEVVSCLPRWPNSCSKPLVWAGQALLILTIMCFQHSLLLQDRVIFMSHWLTSILSNLTFSYSEV